MTEEDRALPRKRDIEAAIAAYNATDPEALLPPAAARLLIIMFPRGSVCQRSLDDLATEGIDRRSVSRLLRALVEAGFLSKEPGVNRAPNTYRLHLLPQRQR
jgi:hypothetical protein